MKTKLKQMLLPALFMIIIIAITTQISAYWDFGLLSPYVGILFVSGLIFGPYGALGAVLTNIIIDLYSGFSPFEALLSAIISFGVALLAYKIWYIGLNLGSKKITKPKLDNTYNLLLFLLDLLICGLIYSVAHGNLYNLLNNIQFDIVAQNYFLMFINFGFISGIICIWYFKEDDFVAAPKPSKKIVNQKIYNTLAIFLLGMTVCLTASLYIKLKNIVLIEEIILFTISLYAYLTRPLPYEIQESKTKSIIEKITSVFLAMTLIIAIFGIFITFLGSTTTVLNIKYLEQFIPTAPLIVITDLIIILFFIPGFYILRYLERKIINPITSFSEIEEFIIENEKIEAEGLLNIYSDYIDEKTEIGKLARSYTNLINHNNEYISNIKEIEGEKERIEAELNIATKIQASNLPTKAIETDDFIINGYSHPAKEVGGDFFDYYLLDDENLAIVIGDASGKGVPAALLSTITQAITKQMLKTNKNPSEVLYSLNNQLCENNSETMFITVWLGIYNKNTRKLTYSNAGHDPPLIKENNKFEYLNIKSGLVLGIMEDYEFVCDEITLSDELVIYTDGITDANNTKEEMYGGKRLKKFFNNFKSDEDPIVPLLSDIKKFTGDEEQYDDMTVVYLRTKT